MIRGSLLLVPTSENQRGAEAGIQLLKELVNHTYVMGTSIKIKKDGVRRASGMVNTWRYWQWCTWRGHGRSEPLPTYLA